MKFENKVLIQVDFEFFFRFSCQFKPALSSYKT